MFADSQTMSLVRRSAYSGVNVVYAFLIIGLLITTIVSAGGFARDSDASQDSLIKDAINVREINVCDEEGNVRFRVSATRSGAELTFLGLKEKRRILIFSDDSGGGISFYDAAGTPRLGMAAGTNVSEVILFGQDRKRMVHLYASTKRSASLIGIYDSDGDPRISIGTSPQDTSVAIYDEKENIRAVLGTTSKMQKRRTESSVSVFTENGKVIWETPTPE